jgi:DNA-damage-inducible protein J
LAEIACAVAKVGYIRFMRKTANICARVEPDLKNEVEDILEQLRLTTSETVRLLYRQIKLQHGLPFDMRIPNKLTTRTLHASKAGRGVKRFVTKKKLYTDLGCENPQPDKPVQKECQARGKTRQRFDET